MTGGQRLWRLAAAASCMVAPAGAALGQSISIDLGDSGSMTGQLIRMVVAIAVLSLAPSLLVTVTSFTRIVVVLAFLRSALGLQQTPPNTVLISLALFITAFIMTPTLERMYQDGIAPLLAEQIDEQTAFERGVAPLRGFMLSHVRQKDLELFLEIGGVAKIAQPEDTPIRVLVPAFMISELRRAFEIGFLIFLPFLIIDMVVASILMSMGMMMLPPVMISLPFKLIFFVLVDGWYLIVGSLVESYQV